MRLLHASPLLLTGLLGAIGALGGCSPNLSPQQQADLNRRDACTDYANRLYRQQNRDLLSRGDETGTPFSASGNRAAPSAGLSEQFHQDNVIADCMANGGPPTASTMRDIRSSTEAILNAPR